jgi:hypothetical protein
VLAEVVWSCAGRGFVVSFASTSWQGPMDNLTPPRTAQRPGGEDTEQRAGTGPPGRAAGAAGGHLYPSRGGAGGWSPVVEEDGAEQQRQAEDPRVVVAVRV